MCVLFFIYNKMKASMIFFIYFFLIIKNCRIMSAEVHGPLSCMARNITAYCCGDIPGHTYSVDVTLSHSTS